MVHESKTGHLVLPDRILYHHCLGIQDDIISSIKPTQIDEASPSTDVPYCLPGFRDNHVHDWLGQNRIAQQSTEASVERFSTVMKVFADQGVTSATLATFGASLDDLIAYCHAARLWMDHPDNGKTGAKLLGINIEGSFINDECRGAQPVEFVLIPGQDDCISAIDRLYATGALRMANIVPDYGEPSLQLIKHTRNLGVMVGSGHTIASADLFKRAYEESDLQYLVHYCNGKIGQSFKPFDGGGAFEAGLNLPLVKELVVDLVHIDSRYLLDLIKQTEERWGLEKIVVVTDATFPIVSEIPTGNFSIGSTLAYRDPKGFLLATHYRDESGCDIAAPPSTLCGSILSMNQAFANLVTLFTQDIQGHWYDHKALSLDDAIIRATKLCATNQAQLEGVSTTTGSIEIGKQASLALGHLTQTNEGYRFKPDSN